MPAVIADPPSPVNHVFVDFENVHQIDLAVIGSKAVSFTLVVGPRQTKLDVSLVEKLFEHAVSVQLVRLTSVGRNALDFAVAYYVGRAVAADPTGYFHIVSKDKGYDALIEHLRSKHIRARRHEGFATLTCSAAAKPPPAISPVPTVAAQSPDQPKPPATHLETLEARVLDHFRKPTTNRPRTRSKLVSHLITHLGKKVTEADVLALVEMLGQGGHLVSDDKGRVTYHLDRT